MKQLINLLNTTLQSNQSRLSGRARPDSASDRALSSVAAADDDISDVAIVQPQSKPNLGVTFVKASPSVITVPSELHAKADDDDSVYSGAEPHYQLGTLLNVLTVDCVKTTGAALDRKNASLLYNLPPKMAAAFHGLITNAGLMAAGMSYSYSSQKQTTSLYVYI